MPSIGTRLLVEETWKDSSNGAWRSSWCHPYVKYGGIISILRGKIVKFRGDKCCVGVYERDGVLTAEPIQWPVKTRNKQRAGQRAGGNNFLCSADHVEQDWLTKPHTNIPHSWDTHDCHHWSLKHTERGVAVKDWYAGGGSHSCFYVDTP